MSDIITKLRAVIEDSHYSLNEVVVFRDTFDPTTAALFVDLLEEAKWFADQPGTAALSGAIDAIHKRLGDKL